MSFITYANNERAMYNRAAMDLNIDGKRPPGILIAVQDMVAITATAFIAGTVAGYLGWILI